jgi:hypothetical protein
MPYSSLTRQMLSLGNVPRCGIPMTAMPTSRLHTYYRGWRNMTE